MFAGEMKQLVFTVQFIKHLFGAPTLSLSTTAIYIPYFLSRTFYLLSCLI